MNNNFYNFNQNPFFRSVPSIGFNPVMMNSSRTIPRSIGLPRISSLFAGGRSGSTLGGASNAVRVAGTSKLSFSSILTGANKTLNVINQAIPVYNQVRPIWKNAKTMFRVVKEMNTSDVNISNSSSMVNDSIVSRDINNNVIEAAIEEKTIEKESNSPTFFI